MSTSGSDDGFQTRRGVYPKEQAASKLNQSAPFFLVIELTCLSGEILLFLIIGSLNEEGKAPRNFKLLVFYLLEIPDKSFSSTSRDRAGFKSISRA